MDGLWSNLYSCPDLLVPGRKPVYPVTSKHKNLISALILTPNRKYVDVMPTIKWAASGSPAFDWVGGITSGVDYGIQSAASKHLACSNQQIVNLPTTDEFTVAWQAIMNSSAYASPAIISWDGADDIVIYHGSSPTNAIRIFWRDFGGNVITGSSNILATLRRVHCTFRKSGSNFICDCYVDGLLHDTNTVADVARGPFSEFRVGSWGGQYAPGAVIGSVFLFDVALQGHEVKAHCRDWYGYALEPTNPIPLSGAIAAPAGNIAPQHFHHRHHNRAG